MKELQEIKKFLLNFLVFVLGITVFLLISIVAIPINIFIHIFGCGVYAYSTNLWLAFDQLANASLGRHHDTTISGTLGYKKAKGELNWFEKKLVWFLDLVDTNHTKKAVENDEDHEYRTRGNKNAN